MNSLKILTTGLMFGVIFIACNKDCYECIASDKNGQADSVSDEICEANDAGLSVAEAENFKASFETLHDTALYDISCVYYTQ